MKFNQIEDIIQLEIYLHNWELVIVATHLIELKCGSRIYYISHSGDTIYYSTEGKGKGTTTIKGLKFKNNQILDASTNKQATEFAICQKMGK